MARTIVEAGARVNREAGSAMRPGAPCRGAHPRLQLRFINSGDWGPATGCAAAAVFVRKAPSTALATGEEAR
jgi:hypothetical protein